MESSVEEVMLKGLGLKARGSLTVGSKAGGVTSAELANKHVGASDERVPTTSRTRTRTIAHTCSNSSRLLGTLQGRRRCLDQFINLIPQFPLQRSQFLQYRPLFNQSVYRRVVFQLMSVGFEEEGKGEVCEVGEERVDFDVE